MTSEPKQQYIERVRQERGSNLKGVEAIIYREAEDAQRAVDNALARMERARQLMKHLEMETATLAGRSDLCYDLLWAAQQHRAAVEPKDSKE